jgi:hypothetical protein
MGAHTDQALVERLFNSITDTLPAWGTPERTAVSQAYSDVMGYITIAALAFSVPVVLLALILPDKRLGDGHNLVQEPDAKPDDQT